MVEVGDVGEGPAAEEAVPDIADGAFHLALGAGPIGPAEPGPKSELAGEGKKGRVEAGPSALRGEHHHLLVVIEDLLGHAPEAPEGVHVEAPGRCRDRCG